MRKKATWPRILIVAVVLAVYIAVLVRNQNESSRRSLQLRDDAEEADRVLVSLTVTNVNPGTRELTAQLGFRPVGKIAQDEVTPAANLKLLVNNVRGLQEFDFPKGKRMNRIEAVFPLDGDINRYPLDRYETTLWLFMTTPGRSDQPQAPNNNENVPEEMTPHAGHLTVSTAALQRNVPVPLSVFLSASIPGIRFRGKVSRASALGVTGINLNLSRADNVIAVSIVVMVMMSCLAMSVLAMVLSAMTAGRKLDLLPLSLSITLIFGLPALRNVQPGVPPVGAFGDYVSFIWAELIVAVSAVITVWTWLLRSEPER